MGLWGEGGVGWGCEGGRGWGGAVGEGMSGGANLTCLHMKR